MGKVTITLANGQLGQTIQTNDGIVGLVLTGGIDGTGDYVLGTPIVVTSTAGLTAAGITEDGNAFAVRQVAEFYAQAGTGAVLYLMLVTNTLTVADMADVENAEGAKKLLDFAGGRIKVLGIMSNDDEVGEVTVTDGLNEAVYFAINGLRDMAATYFAKQMPFRALVGGTSYTGTPSELVPIMTYENNRVGVILGDTENTDRLSAALGLALGTVAKLSVERKISRVANGALPILEANLGRNRIEDLPGDTDLIAAAGFITWTAYPHKAGYFWSSDRMAAADTDDYLFLGRGRVIDKVQVLAYKTFVETVDDEVPVDPATGKMTAGYCRSLEQSIENQINQSMTERGEISGVTAFVDPEQNVLSTGSVAVSIGITPVGYSTTIEITLGFQNPALS